MFRTISNVMLNFDCSREAALRYIDLRDEGYGVEQAALMAGISDPPEDDISERQMQDQEQPDDDKDGDYYSEEAADIAESSTRNAGRDSR